MSRYAKAILAGILALSAWGVTASSDGVYDDQEWWGLLAAIATPVGTYLIPNTPPPGEPRRPDVSEMAA